MSLKLYELSTMYNRLLDLDGEYDIEAALNTITEDFGTKVENTAKVIRSLEAEAKACEEELARLDRHAAALRARAKRVKEYILSNMLAVNMTSIKGSLFTVRIQNSTPSCEIIDEAALLPEWRSERTVVVVDIDKHAIIRAWKAEQETPGAIIHQGQYIRIYP